MVIAKLNGGLGNQLFQYAAAKSLALHHNVPLKIDISSFARQTLPELEVPRDFELYNFQGVNDEIAVLSEKENEDIIKFLKKISLQKLLPNHKRKIYSEPHFHFDKNFFDSNKNVLLYGQWQSEKYFLKYCNFFSAALQLKQNLIDRIIPEAWNLKSINSVAVHVRRTDYLRLPTILDWHGVMEKEYYVKAFNMMRTKVGDFKAYYFSDDVEWVQKTLLPVQPGEILSNLTKTHYEDFYLMSQCQHNIIANSSFSWWSAWLNDNPEKIVVGPKNWFHNGPKDTYDILPENWIKI